QAVLCLQVNMVTAVDQIAGVNMIRAHEHNALAVSREPKRVIVAMRCRRQMRAGAEIEQMRAVRICRCEKSAIVAEVKGRKTHGGGQWDLQSPKNGAMIQLPDAQALALARVADVLIITTELEPKTSTRDEQRFAGASVPKSRAPIPCCGHQQIS